MKLLETLVDDAGLFPPTALDMRSAVTRHRRDQAEANAMLTHRFLCPASRITDLRDELDTSDRIALGLIADQDDLVGAYCQLAGDPRLSLALLEIPLARFGSTAALNLALPESYVPVFVEPVAPTDVDTVLDSLPEGFGMKLRCGGTRADLFPKPGEVAHFISACVDAGVPFKATAGLHHAIRHQDPATGFVHHGYLNLLLATALATAGESEEGLRRALEIEDAGELGRQVAELDDDTAAATRRALVSYGSCSTSTPVQEARTILSTTRKDEL